MRDVWLVLMVWVLGRISDMKNRDLVTQEKCLQSCSGLEKQLLKSLKLVSSPSRTEANYHENLIEMKSTIKRLSIERLGLMVPIYSLNICLSESNLIFKEYDPDHSNVAYHSAQTMVRLHFAWGTDNGRRVQFDKIEKIQQDLSVGFFRRSMAWLKARFKLFRWLEARQVTKTGDPFTEG